MPRPKNPKRGKVPQRYIGHTGPFQSLHKPTHSYTQKSNLLNNRSSSPNANTYRMKLRLTAMALLTQSTMMVLADDIATLPTEQPPRCFCPDGLSPCTTCFINPPAKEFSCSRTCNTKCVNFGTDPSNCGSCGNIVSFLCPLEIHHSLTHLNPQSSLFGKKKKKPVKLTVGRPCSRRHLSVFSWRKMQRGRLHQSQRSMPGRRLRIVQALRRN